MNPRKFLENFSCGLETSAKETLVSFSLDADLRSLSGLTSMKQKSFLYHGISK
jgi:hypothetical protein